MSGLSVIIITKNEAQNIRACLESVKWAREIIVVDSGSTDDTVAICKEYTPHVHHHAWPGFGPQKNHALSFATQEWVFSIDADERVTSELRAEIDKTMQEGNLPGYELPRLSSFCGRYMQHSGWYPDYVTRLFRRGQGEFSKDLVHERVIIQGTTGRLKQNLLHESFRDLDQLLAKMNHYSTAGAKMLTQKGRDVTLLQAILHGLWAFVRSYLLRAGFLDGAEGFMVSVSTAEGTYYRYAKRLMLQKQMQREALHIVEPTLSGTAGHCYSFIKSLLDANSNKTAMQIWANRQAGVRLDYPQVQLNRYFHRALRKMQAVFLYRRLLRQGNRLFIATAGRADLLALKWAAKGRIPKHTAYLYFHWFRATPSKLRLLHKLAVQQPDLVIMGPTATVIEPFRQAGFSDIRIVPYPITKTHAASNGSQPFRHILFAGAARADKGFSYVVDLIKYLNKIGAAIPVLVQTSAEHFGKYDAQTLADIERLKAINYPHLTMKSQVLNEQEYADLYRGAIALQLYRMEDFADRISGVTLDAFSAGCPIVTTAGTWMARMAERFKAGLAVNTFAPEILSAQINEIIGQYATFQARARQGGESLQQENSAEALYRNLTE